MSGCCNERGCKRAKPMLLMRGGLTGVWYVVTDYSQDGDGVVARQKHRLPDAVQDQLNALGSDDER